MSNLNNLDKLIKQKLNQQLFNEQDLKAAMRGNEYPVYVTRNKSDYEELKKLNPYYIATYPIKGHWTEYCSRVFKARKVIVLADHSKDGAAFLKEIRDTILNYAMWCMPLMLPDKDIYDNWGVYLKDQKSTDAFEELFSSQVLAGGVKYCSWIYTTEDRQGNVKLHVNPGLLSEQIEANELYKIIRNPQDDKDTFLIYQSGVYAETNKNGIKSIIKDYIPPSICTDAILNNVCGILKASSDSSNHIIDISEVNTDERFVNLEDGLFDIKQRKLVEHTPDVVYTLQLPIKYSRLDEPIPNFEKFINDLCTDSKGQIDEDRIKVIQEFMGLALSNVSAAKVKQILVLYAPTGNNGKSVLGALMGQYIDIISPQLTDLQPEHRFILGDLYKARMILVFDGSSAEINDSSVIKSLSGGVDKVKIEGKGKQPFYYQFPGAFWIFCNRLPYFQDDRGQHLMERLKIVPCEHTVPDEERDTDLINKLSLEKAGIFQWAMAGLYRLMENNYHFSKCEACDLARIDYHKKADNLWRYVTEEYIITKNKTDRIKRSVFDESYSDWVHDRQTDDGEDIKEVKKGNIPPRLMGYGVPMISSHNENYYTGIVAKSEFKAASPDDENLFDDDNMDIPF